MKQKWNFLSNTISVGVSILRLNRSIFQIISCVSKRTRILSDQTVHLMTPFQSLRTNLEKVELFEENLAHKNPEIV